MSKRFTVTLNLWVFSRRAAEVDDKDNFIEHRGSDAGSSYLQLDQLGRVLKSISTLVPGM